MPNFNIPGVDLEGIINWIGGIAQLDLDDAGVQGELSKGAHLYGRSRVEYQDVKLDSVVRAQRQNLE